MSTGRTSTINQALGIALIVFVMLTFVLTVTTYLFFGQKLLAENKEKEALAVQENAGKTLAASEEEKKELREILGFDDGVTLDEMREEFAKLFPDYEGERKAFLPLAKWLDDARCEKDTQLDAAQKAQSSAESDKEKADKALKDAEAAFAKKLQESGDRLQVVEKEAADRRSKFEEVERALVAEKEAALRKIDEIKLIVEAIDKGQGLVKPPRSFEGKTPAERATVLQDVIRDRDRTIESLERSEFLKSLAATDPPVQMFVLEAINAEDAEIEQLRKVLDRLKASGGVEEATRIDGRIVAVDQREQSVTISCASTFGIRPGLVFNVHAGTLPRGTVLPVKAVVEVVGVDGGSLVRGRIRRDSIEDPIVVGDAVSTPLWSPGKPLEVVILGWVDFGGEAGKDEKNLGQGDFSQLAEIVRRAGGTVARSVSPTTTVVVDAGSDTGLKPQEEKRRSGQLAEARRLGVRTLLLDEFLSWLGQERPGIPAPSVLVPGTERIPQSRAAAAE